ncbi:MAG: hypothetical protein ACLR8Y_16975 [Alistipes indistinctus]
MERYAGYLHDSGFVVTFGSEHNTPAMESIELFARGGVPLTRAHRQRRMRPRRSLCRDRHTRDIVQERHAGSCVDPAAAWPT